MAIIQGQDENVGVIGKGDHIGVQGSVPLPPKDKAVLQATGPELPSAGVAGVGQAQHGIFGLSITGHGVFGQSKTSRGVGGISESDIGVAGFSTTGHGVFGQSKTSRGVGGISESDIGVAGFSTTDHGVFGQSKTSRGVGGISESDIGVFGISTTGIGVVGRGGKAAGRFEGDVEVTGNITTVGSVTVSDIFLVNGGDCAEDFDIAEAEQIDPGTVMVIDEEGALQQSRQAYDKRVAGVVSGAGDLRPGIVLDKQKSRGNRLPIALLGKVYCKVDAQYAPVEVGDLLTTSPTPGFAMKADSPLKAFGAVIGKALRRLEAGQALIPVLVALQ